MEEILKKFKSILHCGACNGEEIFEYVDYFDKVVFVEANPELIPNLKNLQNFFPIIKNVYDKAIFSENDKTINFNIIYSDDRTNPGCSSILELKEHLDYYPHIKKVKEVSVPTITIDKIIENDGEFDILYMDLQGAEMIALSGCKDLTKFKCIYTEMSIADLYEGCGKINEITNLLNNNGFSLVKTIFLDNRKIWCDGIFIRNDLMKGI